MQAKSSLGWAKDRMWSQYGDQHRGICIALDRGLLEEQAQWLRVLGERFVYWRDVSYRDDSTYPPWPNGATRTGTPESRRMEWEQSILPFHFFTKRQDWEHESEYRILVLDYAAGAMPFVDLDIAAAIRSLIVGAKFPSVYRRCIQKLCDDLRIPAYRYALDGRVATLEEYVVTCSDGISLA